MTTSPQPETTPNDSIRNSGSVKRLESWKWLVGSVRWVGQPGEFYDDTGSVPHVTGTNW